MNVTDTLKPTITANRFARIVIGFLCFLSFQLQAEILAITGATVIDGTGADPIKNAVVLISEGRITAVGKRSSVSIPDAAKRYAAKGKYIIPGLMDANLHLANLVGMDSLIKYEGRYEDIITEAAQITLKTGQTTVFDTWGPRAPLASVRDQINKGETQGSRFFLAGNIIGFGGPLSSTLNAAGAQFVSSDFVKRTNQLWEENTGRQLISMGPEEVRRELRRYIATGVDFLKYAGSGYAGDIGQFITFSSRVQKVIVDEAHAAGLVVQAHVLSEESLNLVIDAGVDIVTHCGVNRVDRPISDGILKKMVMRGTACSILPITQRRLDALIALSPASETTKQFKIAKQNHRRLIQAGVPLLLSTDGSVFDPKWAENVQVEFDPLFKLGEGHFNGLVALQEIGMAPMEILKSVTSNTAKAYKKDQDIGTLEVGKFADMVILDKNPLKDAKHYRRIHAVIKEGVMVDIDSLPTAPVFSAPVSSSKH